MFYNKAYDQYRCAVLHPTSIAEMKECVRKANLELGIYLKLATEYFSTVAPRSARCEMKNRLFGAEIEFPPFSFLGNAQLMTMLV
jgi:hypothetical protein